MIYTQSQIFPSRLFRAPSFCVFYLWPKKRMRATHTERLTEKDTSTVWFFVLINFYHFCYSFGKKNKNWNLQICRLEVTVCVRRDTSLRFNVNHVTKTKPSSKLRDHRGVMLAIVLLLVNTAFAHKHHDQAHHHRKRLPKYLINETGT